ncbi:hypothetical protein PB2503_12524 [Parvularcula bermudensis HTCC2503]|uniref:Methyltransferase n=1 Tax=Parvularcula bermudensis (strain ATCC BAA-594 / HTCC2503 / KCTC 12087) TaxID=314260 RepID=E0TFI5_PARBH|nr:hypothetical protein [Parvularcula bermudensis]ADM10545.1 hypothetical protein PB2503_12524 [Parvularcula bermudensis HTCC2503]
MTVELHMSELPFERRIDLWMLDVLHRQPSSFLQVLRSLPGVFPSAALASLRRLHRADRLNAPTLRLLEYQARSEYGPIEVDLTLPPPHPLNYEWRFTHESAQFMISEAKRRSGVHGQILMLGTPGVARSALKVRPGQGLTFLGEDNHVTRLLEAENNSVGSPITLHRCGASLPAGFADTVLLDPPWYTDFVEKMLRTAAFACRSDGVVLFSLAPVGTNRSAYKHRADVFSLAESYGLQLESINEAALAYETPYFEANALRAAGLGAPAVWRRADFATFRKSSGVVERTDTSSTSQSQWIDLQVGRMRVFVRRSVGATVGASAALRPLLDGDILPTVSRHDPRREGADLWTSGNRIFKCSRPDLVIAAASLTLDEIIARGSSGPSTTLLSEIDATVRLKYKLQELATREAAEERGLILGEETWIEKSTFQHSPNTSMGTAGG